MECQSVYLDMQYNLGSKTIKEIMMVLWKNLNTIKIVINDLNEYTYKFIIYWKNCMRQKSLWFIPYTTLLIIWNLLSISSIEDNII